MAIKVLEKEIQLSICDYLKLRRHFFWRQNVIPAIDKNGNFRAMPKYSKNGVPDIILIKGGLFWGIEVKRPGGKLRPAQEEFRDGLVEAGGRYDVVTSLDDVMALGL